MRRAAGEGTGVPSLDGRLATTIGRPQEGTASDTGPCVGNVVWL